MPYLEESSGNVVTRVVYDGPPEAGKTTNLRMILEQVGEFRAGRMLSPLSNGRQTEFFDWLEFSGGFLDGRKVHCQVLSVPGQAELARRRELILEMADVIVFVVDSRPGQSQKAARMLASTLKVIERSARNIGLVLQANKQDVEDASAPEVLRRELNLPEECTLVGAASGTGQGVMYTFVMAVRLAIDRARKLLAAGNMECACGEFDDPHQLLERMLSSEREVRPPGSLEQDVFEAARAQYPPLPDPARIRAGHVWPPHGGRECFARAVSGSLRRHTVFVEDMEVLSVSNSEGWRLQSFPDDDYVSEAEAQRQLVETAQRCQKCERWLEPSLAIAIYPQPTGWRLWTAHRPKQSLREVLVSTKNEDALEALLKRVQDTERCIRQHPPCQWLVDALSLDSMAVDHGGLFLQAVRYPGVANEGATLLSAAKRLVRLVAPDSVATIEEGAPTP